MDDRWLSVEEIARYLGVSRDTIYAWVSTQRMPARRVGRLWKFKQVEVDRWVNDGGAAVAAHPTSGRAPARGDEPSPSGKQRLPRP